MVLVFLRFRVKPGYDIGNKFGYPYTVILHLSVAR